MNKVTYALLALFSLSIANAEENIIEEKQITSIKLKYITGDDVVSVLNSLIDESVLIREENNVLFINGKPDKTKNIIHIINKIDTPPVALTIEFIASSRKINFEKSGTTYQTRKNNTTQTMSITERQWITLNTGLSIPISERRRYADGTETQIFRYKKISKRYIFKVHEFSGWSVVQVGLNVSSLSNDITDAIEHTELDTTIVGKTGEWLEVASTRDISETENSQIYTTDRTNKHHIYLYVKINKAMDKTQAISETEIIK